VANTLNLFCTGAVGFIDWLDGVAMEQTPKHYQRHPDDSEDKHKHPKPTLKRCWRPRSSFRNVTDARRISTDETKRCESRYEEAQHSHCENARADRPVESRIVRRRNDLTGTALRSVTEGPTLEIAVSELREDNAEDKEERRYDWDSEQLLHLTRHKISHRETWKTLASEKGCMAETQSTHFPLSRGSLHRLVS